MQQDEDKEKKISALSSKEDPEAFQAAFPDWEPAPDDFAPSPKRLLYPLQVAPRYSSGFWTITTILLSAVMSWLYWTQPQLTNQMAISGQDFFQNKEYWRAFTAIFCHGDINHLLSNLLFLSIFSWLVHAYCGFWTYPIIALALATLTNIITVYFYPPQVQLVGASGLVYVLFGYWISLFLRNAHHLSKTKRVLHVSGFFMIIIFPETYKPQVSYLAHAIGFSLGFIFGWPQIKSKET